MKVDRWPGGGREPELNSLISLLREDGLDPVVMYGHPGKHYPTHSHPNAQVRWAISGSLKIGVRLKEADDRPIPEELQWIELDLGPGDRVELPVGTEHWIRLGPQGASYLLANRKR